MAAERVHGIPPQLLAAIGRVESGRRDPDKGTWGAWPWTINAEGQGAWFETKADAVHAVESLQARGVRSIDVGCMQVNLMHHPEAFPNLRMAFEPAVNADYAGRFLHQLFDQTGDWTKATAYYHSATPSEGGPYAAKVTSVWPEEQRKAAQAPTIMAFAPSSPVASPFIPFAARRPARVLPLAGLTPGSAPGMLTMGVQPGGIPSGDPTAARVPRLMAPGMTLAGTTPNAAPGQISMNGGRTLDFYRAMPIPVMPLRLASRQPGRFTIR